MNEKTIENRCRRQLAKYGYALRKNRAKTGENVGGYMIVESNTNVIEEGHDGVNWYTFTLDDVVDWIEAKPFIRANPFIEK